MTNPDPELVTCPSCGKAYRWKPPLVGRLVPCKKCGTEFTIPNKPGQGQPVDQSEDSQASVYALALDIEDEPQADAAPPPRPTKPPAEHTPPPPAVSTTGSETPGPVDSETETEEPAQVSEAAKAIRREEQRKAAAEAEPVRSWRDYKAVIIVGVLLLIGALALWLILNVSDALDGFLGMAV